MTQAKKDIHVGFVTDTFPLGGAERNMIDIGNFLSERNFTVYVFCAENVPEAYPVDKKQLFEIVELGPQCHFNEEKTIEAIKQFTIREGIKIDVIISGYFPEKYIYILKDTLGCKYIFPQQGPPFYEAQYQITQIRERKGFTFWLKKRFFIPLTNNRFFHFYVNRVVGKYRPIYDACDVYTCLCDEYKRQFDKYFRLTDNESKVKVVYNFEFTPETLPKTKRDKTILYVGRLSKEDKRVDRLLRIWKMSQDKLPEWNLVIAGHGPEWDNLETMSKDLNLQRCKFLGWVNNATELMRHSSILCLTSDCEGWGLVLTEAQANGLPAIAFDTSAGVHTILAPNGTNGILIPPGKEKAYSKALVVLAKDEDKRMTIAKNAFHAVKRFTLEETGKRWIEIIDALAKE